jgi:hypothetical protein
VDSRPFGGTFTLDALWPRLGIDTVLTSLDTGPSSTPRRGRLREVEVTERVLFALVANRALASTSQVDQVIAVDDERDLGRGLPDRDGQHDCPSGSTPVVEVEAVYDLQQLTACEPPV